MAQEDCLDRFAIPILLGIILLSGISHYTGMTGKVISIISPMCFSDDIWRTFNVSLPDELGGAIDINMTVSFCGDSGACSSSRLLIDNVCLADSSGKCVNKNVLPKGCVASDGWTQQKISIPDSWDPNEQIDLSISESLCGETDCSSSRVLIDRLCLGDREGNCLSDNLFDQYRAGFEGDKAKLVTDMDKLGFVYAVSVLPSFDLAVRVWGVTDSTQLSVASNVIGLVFADQPHARNIYLSFVDSEGNVLSAFNSDKRTKVLSPGSDLSNWFPAPADNELMQIPGSIEYYDKVLDCEPSDDTDPAYRNALNTLISDNLDLPKQVDEPEIIVMTDPPISAMKYTVCRYIPGESRGC